MCGKSARTVRSGGDRKRAYGNDYTGTKPETADTAKSEPTGYRAGPRPYHALVREPRRPRANSPIARTLRQPSTVAARRAEEAESLPNRPPGR